jgi:hypothetical protein
MWYLAAVAASPWLMRLVTVRLGGRKVRMLDAPSQALMEALVRDGWQLRSYGARLLVNLVALAAGIAAMWVAGRLAWSLAGGAVVDQMEVAWGLFGHAPAVRDFADELRPWLHVVMAAAVLFAGLGSAGLLGLGVMSLSAMVMSKALWLLARRLR